MTYEEAAAAIQNVNWTCSTSVSCRGRIYHLVSGDYLRWKPLKVLD